MVPPVWVAFPLVSVVASPRRTATGTAPVASTPRSIWTVLAWFWISLSMGTHRPSAYPTGSFTVRAVMATSRLVDAVMVSRLAHAVDPLSRLDLATKRGQSTFSNVVAVAVPLETELPKPPAT